MYNQSYIEGGVLDTKNYQIIIISHQLRDKDLLHYLTAWKAECPVLDGGDEVTDLGRSGRLTGSGG